jgi:hypothetical protein
MKKTFTLLCLLFIFSLKGIFGQTIPSNTPSNGLLAYYPFNGNANDESGNGNNLTNHFVNFAADNQRGQIASFNGSAWLDKGSALFTTVTPITFSFWAKTGSTSSMDILGQACGKDCGDDIRIQLNAAQCGYTGLSFKSPAFFATAPANTADNNWHHFMLIMGENGNYSYSNFKFYIDGVFVAIGPSVCSHNWGGWTYKPNDTYNFAVGQAGPLGYYFNGSLDDICIWNRALTSTEITALYVSQATTPAHRRFRTNFMLQFHH